MSRARRSEPDDPLYEVPPAAFVAARNQLVKDLRARDNTDAAKAVAELRKPTVALWAANQVARRDRAAVDHLLTSVARLKAAHVARPKDLREAIEQQREAVDELVQSARTALASINLSVTPELIARVSATLMGAAVDPGARDDLRAGRLATERAAPGFDAFGDTPAPRPVATDRATPPKKAPGVSVFDRKVVALDDARRRRDVREARATEEAARAREEENRALEHAARARDEEAREAKRRKARELEDAAARHRAEADTAATHADTLKRELAELKRREAEARRTVITARRAATAAARDARRASAGVTRPRRGGAARTRSRAR